MRIVSVAATRFSPVSVLGRDVRDANAQDGYIWLVVNTVATCSYNLFTKHTLGKIGFTSKNWSPTL